MSNVKKSQQKKLPENGKGKIGKRLSICSQTLIVPADEQIKRQKCLQREQDKKKETPIKNNWEIKICMHLTEEEAVKILKNKPDIENIIGKSVD